MEKLDSSHKLFICAIKSYKTPIFYNDLYAILFSEVLLKLETKIVVAPTTNYVTKFFSFYEGRSN